VSTACEGKPIVLARLPLMVIFYKGDTRPIFELLLNPALQTAERQFEDHFSVSVVI